MNDFGYEFYFRHIAAYFSAIQKHELFDVNITKQQVHLLQYISHSIEEGRSVTRRDLQEIMGGLKGPSITSLLNALSRNGFLIRNPAAHDGRYMELTVTNAGYDVVQRMEQITQELEKKLVSNMREDEQAEFQNLLRKAFQNMADLYSEL